MPARSRPLGDQHVDLAAVLGDDQLLRLAARVGVDGDIRDRAVEPDLYGIGIMGEVPSF